MAMKRDSVKNLTNIKERKPIILKVEGRGTRWEDAPDVLHISRKEGEAQNYGLHKGTHSENITNCGRILQYPGVYTKGAIPSPEQILNGTYKLCSRCGTPEDFQQALNEYWTWRAEADKELKAKEEQRRQEERREWERYLKNLQDLADILTKENFFDVEVDEKNGRAIIKMTEYRQNWLQVTQYEKGRDE